MSRFCSGGTVNGLLIKNEEDIKYFVDSYIRKNINEFDVEDMDEAMGELREDMMMSLESGERFTCSEDKERSFFANHYTCDIYDGLLFTPSSPESEGSFSVDIYDEPILIASDRPLSSRSIFKGGYYENFDELVNEFKEKVGGYLPDGFDFENSIGDLDFAMGD